MNLKLDVEYSAAQHRMYFESAGHKYRIFPKGRRLGATRGAANAYIEKALEGKAILWGDTINANIDRYVDRYFKPTLDKNRVPYSWNTQKRLMKIGPGFIDFRSAENPDNWEGFGYHEVFLNEAGIILMGENGRYLYQNAVMPMMMDFKESSLCAAGVPKGMAGSLFYELYLMAKKGAEGYYTPPAPFTARHNPWIAPGSLETLAAEMLKVGGQSLVDQEAYGKFVNTDDGTAKVIPMEWVRAAQARWALRPGPAPGVRPDAIGADVARGGGDSNALALRYADFIAPLVVTPGKSTPDGGAYAALVVPHLAPHTRVHIDVVGVGTSPHDHLKGIHPHVYPINGAAKTLERDRSGLLNFANLRAACYWRLREALNPDYGATLALPPGEQLAEDLNACSWKLTAQGVLIEPKEAVKVRLGRSPDLADAVAYAVYTPPGDALLTASNFGW